MKKIIFILLVGLTFVFSSCEVKDWFIENDTSDSVSAVSVKPMMVLVGEPIISIEQGGNYVEEGVLASEVILGDNDLKDKTIIESGSVDVNVKDFYTVTYKSTNTYGWVSYVYRSVLVHDGTPYGEEIGYDDYKLGFAFNAKISKNTIPGYWEITGNVFQEPNAEPYTFIFADKEDGTYGVVNGVHPTKGRYWGTVERTYPAPPTTFDDGLLFKITFLSSEGVETTKEYPWYSKKL